MKLNKLIALTMLLLMLTGCVKAAAGSGKESEAANVSVSGLNEIAETGRVVEPLPDTTMEDLNDAVLSVSLNEGDAYVDDSGIMQMQLKIYSYDQYDMIDVAALEPGDQIVGHRGTVKVTSVERADSGAVSINGGLEKGGFDLVTDGFGVFYEMGANDAKSWYEVGEATIRVSVDFIGIDTADLEQGEVTVYPGDFLVGAVTNYDFTPYNTTVRVENGQIVELHRVFIP